MEIDGGAGLCIAAGETFEHTLKRWLFRSKNIPK